MADLEYPMVVLSAPDVDGGGFLALAPDLPGCMGDGDTQEAAIADLRNAILEWIDEATELGRPIPAPGAGAVEARAERKTIREILKNQDELIKVQEEAIRGYRAQLNALRRVSYHIESDQSLFRPYVYLEHEGSIVCTGVPVVKKRRETIPN